MNEPLRLLDRQEWPPLLSEIPEPPQQLYCRGVMPAPDLTLVAVVGSRNYSTYGKQVVEHLVGGLRGYPVGIVSGLALGIDSLAHRAALDAGLYTLAIPGSGLNDDVIYPRSHVRLAGQILDASGGLASEYEPDFAATHWSFPRRNRIVVGMCAATLIIEASEKSGTLISARLTADYNRELLAVPGNIFSTNSAGCHQFLKLGATVVTSTADILEALRIEPRESTIRERARSTEEERVLSLLAEPTERDAVVRALGMPTHEAAILLMKMEMEGDIAEENGVFFKKV